jgi:hypothetical protein
VKRSTRGDEDRPDYSALIRAIQYLDEVLKRGVVVGVYEDSMEVSDEDIKRALVSVNSHLDNATAAMEKAARSITRAVHPNILTLQ